MSTDTNTLTAALHDAVVESLENMFFSEVKDVEFYWGSVEVSEPFQGKITVAFPPDLTTEIVNEIFGIEPDDITIEVINDIIAEVANTVAGRLMNTLVDADQTFKLLVPETGMGKLEITPIVSFINHYEMNNKVYLVMLEGESLLKFKEKPLIVEQPDQDDTWG